jgi:hypothetical protein
VTHRSHASVLTGQAHRYGRQLCEHFAHKIEARWDEDHGVADFGPPGTCHLRATDDALELEAVAETEAGLQRVQAVLTDHVERFGRRAGLQVVWEPAGAPSTGDV